MCVWLNKGGAVKGFVFFCCYTCILLYFCKLVKSGEVSEWSKEHAWKVCIRQKRIEGSNPSLSASKIPN
jgi:hypothetical protein